jgi:hypothetical protein
MKIGDFIKTPRFLKVRIAEVFQTEREARKNGYTEPTHYEDDDYSIFGKVTGPNTMIFAAAAKPKSLTQLWEMGNNAASHDD